MKTKQDVDVFRKSLRTDGIVSMQVLDGRHTVGITEFPYMWKLTASVVQVRRSVKSYKMLREMGLRSLPSSGGSQTHLPHAGMTGVCAIRFPSQVLGLQTCATTPIYEVQQGSMPSS